MKDIWLRVLITALVTIAVAGFASQEMQKVDRSEFNMFRSYQDEKLVEIQKTLTEIKKEINDLKERLFYGERMGANNTCEQS